MSKTKRMRILHRTDYFYHEEVEFGTHRVTMHPREGHDVRILSGSLQVEPAASLRWVRDFYGNSIAILEFEAPAKRLSIVGEVLVDMSDTPLPRCAIHPAARQYPFQYPADEQIEIVLYRVPSYPHDGDVVSRWTSGLLPEQGKIDTMELLHALNTHIFASLTYTPRDEPGVQLPCETLRLGSGSCRDYAVLMMEAARHLGFAARFVSGYVRMEEGQHGATHAWTEVYLPGSGWCGFDPTNNKPAGAEHIPAAVARGQEKAIPIQGSWAGPPDAYDRMEVSVQVIAA